MTNENKRRATLPMFMPSGRECSTKMLDAIDQLDQIELKAGPL